MISSLSAIFFIRIGNGLHEIQVKKKQITKPITQKLFLISVSSNVSFMLKTSWPPELFATVKFSDFAFALSSP
ncbi:hypothetical protein YC2023_061620 [Brassica napus]